MNPTANMTQTPVQVPVQERLNTLKARIENARTNKARAEATIEQLDTQRRQVLDELQKLGITEEELPNEIERLQREINEQLAAAEALLGGQNNAGSLDA
jgi:chromosome segregation ATPase